MARPRVSAGGGFSAIAYVLKKGGEVGLLKLYRRLRSRNACKTCALGMGGQKGGMVNEAGHFPEICKKSVQAQAGDMGGAIGEDLFRQNSIRGLGQLSSLELERLGRLAFPVLAAPGESHFHRISWDEAYDRLAGALREAPPRETFFYASGRSSNEAAFLFQLVARAYGTANVHNCSYYCHSASGVALGKVYGSGTSSITLDDLDQADFAMVVGANPASNHPRLITKLVNLRKRGGKVVVINPLKELGLVRFRVPSDWKSLLFGSDVSDLYLQPHVGADIALLKAILKGVQERNAVDRSYCNSHAAGWAEVEVDLAYTPWEPLVEASGVSREEIDKAVDLIVSAKKGVLLWAMGLTHHVCGVDNILALANIAVARGWLGRPGMGLLPIRGHSNVQGVGSVGVGPDLKKAFSDQLERLYGIKAPRDVGQDTYSSMVAAEEGRIRAAVLLGGNLYSSNPDSGWAARALQRIPLTFTVSTKLNEGHIHGRGQTAIIVPALARDEESQSTTQESMFNFVRLSSGGFPSVEGELRSEVDIVASIAEKILPEGRFDWPALRSHESLRQMIAQVVPGYGKIGEIGKAGGEFHIEGRTFHTPKFNTPDGRARFHVTKVPKASLGPDEYRLMTLRSEGQFNTVVYEEEDLYRGNTRRDVVMMSEEDARKRGFAEGDLVEVTSSAGFLRGHVAIVDIRTGNLAMYYPEANVLVPRALDPQSKTPAFKSVAVTLERADKRKLREAAVAAGT